MKKFLSSISKLFYSHTAYDTYWIFGSNIFTSFLAFLYTLFLARTFHPSDFGIFSAIVSFMLLFSDIADFGIGSALSRFLPPLYAQKAKQKADSIIKTTFLFEFRIAVLMLAVVLIFSSSLSLLILKNSIYNPLFILASFGIMGLIIAAFVALTLSAQQKFKAVAIVNSSSTIFKLAAVTLLFLIDKLDLFTATLAFAVSPFVSYAVSFFFLSTKFLKAYEEKGTLAKVLSYSLYLAAARIFSAVGSRLDALLIIPLSSAYEAGIYGSAYKIASLYIMLSSSFSLVIAPKLSGFPDLISSVRYIKKVILATFGILITMVVLYLIAPFFVVFILGPKYFESIEVFRLLLIPMAFFTMTIAPVNFLLYSLKIPQVSTLNTFAQLMFFFFANLYFIPRYGRFGPVITLILAYSFTFISATFFSLYFYFRRKNG